LARLFLAIRDLFALTKPRITALVLLTEAAGAYLAPGAGRIHARWLAFFGTALVVASANALNMWWERDVDGRMERTRARPLPAGRLTPDVALGFALALALVSIPLLMMVNVATGLLALVALTSYVLVYTPLKRRTCLALLVGAVPGAIPPLLGWSTVTGSVGLGGMLLFVFLFLWQVPHFAAITIFRAEDYARAGLQVISVQHGEGAAGRMVAWGALLVVSSSLLFTPFGLAGRSYELVAALAGAAFLALALRRPPPNPRSGSTRWAKSVFALSIPYLSVVLLALLVDRVTK
jgi:protoheme IX farnesyltransferase